MEDSKPKSATVLVAKMFLSEATLGRYPNQDLPEYERVKLQAVYGDGEANKAWSKATPSGSLELTINNPAAIGLLKPGYYKVELIPCGKDD